MGTSKNQEAASGATVKKRGQFKEIWRRLKKNKMAIRENKRDKILLWNRIYSSTCTFSLSY